MNKSFGRIITLLRKEKNLSQKQVANDLDVSQALLSHYEKGIRECSLDFAAKTADYFGVSCDFLLGRTPERNGAMITFKEIEEFENVENNKAISMLPMLNKKIIKNATEYVYSLLTDLNDKELTTDISGYLMTAIYKSLRSIDKIAPNDDGFFSIDSDYYANLSTAIMELYQVKASKRALEYRKKHKDNIPVEITHKNITEEYNYLASSVLNLIHNTEKNIRLKIKL